MDFTALVQQCAPDVHPQTMAAVVHVESTFNPYAIGVVKGRLQRQPRSLAEAVATARYLDQKGYNFSLGVSQVNKYNLAKYGESFETIFDPCRNIKAGASILKDCYVRAKAIYKSDQTALRAAISCYYSGNFNRGFKPDFNGQPSYVQKVVSAASFPAKPIPLVPAISPSDNSANKTQKPHRTGKTAPEASRPAPDETKDRKPRGRGLLYRRNQEEQDA